MNTVTYIPGYENPFYFSFFLDGELKTATHIGTIYSLEKVLRKNRLASIINLIYEFKKLDDKIIDSRKNVHQYSEYIKRIDAYLEWAEKHRDSMLEDCIKNASLVANKYMAPVLDLINDSQELKKYLIGIVHSVIETAKITKEI